MAKVEDTKGWGSVVDLFGGSKKEEEAPVIIGIDPAVGSDKTVKLDLNTGHMEIIENKEVDDES